jgi:hypothetical protein
MTMFAQRLIRMVTSSSFYRALMRREANLAGWPRAELESSYHRLQPVSIKFNLQRCQKIPVDTTA